MLCLVLAAGTLSTTSRNLFLWRIIKSRLDFTLQHTKQKTCLTCFRTCFCFLAGNSCLLCLNSLGKVLAFSLPNLSPLMDVECSFLMSDYRLEIMLLSMNEVLAHSERHWACNIHWKMAFLWAYVTLLFASSQCFSDIIQTIAFSLLVGSSLKNPQDLVSVTNWGILRGTGSTQRYKHHGVSEAAE